MSTHWRLQRESRWWDAACRATRWNCSLWIRCDTWSVFEKMYIYFFGMISFRCFLCRILVQIWVKSSESLRMSSANPKKSARVLIKIYRKHPNTNRHAIVYTPKKYIYTISYIIGWRESEHENREYFIKTRRAARSVPFYMAFPT